MKRILCLILCVFFLFGTAACGKNKNAETGSESENVSDTQQSETYEPEWVLSPSVKATRIFSLPITDFNESSNHYDVTFGELYAFESDGKIGFIDSNGQVIIEPKYDSAETCTCTKQYIVTAKTENGESNYRFSTSNLTPVWSKPHKCQDSNKYRYIWDSDEGKIDVVYFNSGKSLSSVKKVYAPETAEIYKDGTGTGKFTVITAGAAVGSADYTGAGIFTEGIAAVEKDGKWGYVNSKGEQVIPFEYDAVKGYSAIHDSDHDTPYESSEGYVTVLKDGKYGILKNDGTQVIPCMFSYMTTVHNGRVFASENGTDWGILCVDKKISDGIAPSKSTEKTSSTTSKKSSTTTSKPSSKSSSSSSSSQKSSSSSSSKSSVKSSTKTTVKTKASSTKTSTSSKKQN